MLEFDLGFSARLSRLVWNLQGPPDGKRWLTRFSASLEPIGLESIIAISSCKLASAFQCSLEPIGLESHHWRD